MCITDVTRCLLPTYGALNALSTVHTGEFVGRQSASVNSTLRVIVRALERIIGGILVSLSK